MKKYILISILAFLPFTDLVSQQFSFHSNAPFGIQPVLPDTLRPKVGLKYMFTDFDLDSDLDLILMGYDTINSALGFNYKSISYFVDYQENTGDKKHPQFALRVPLIDNFPFVEGLFFPAIGDLDGDGRTDMVVVAEIDAVDAQHLLYYQQRPDGSFNISRMDDMGIDPLLQRSFFTPELTDLDLDGDLDLLMTGYAPEFFDTTGESAIPAFLYAKNIGNKFNPQFLGWFENPFGLTTQPVPNLSVTGDLDLDGDLDILALSSKEDSITLFCFYKNSPGNNGKPAFLAPAESPFNLPVPGIDENYLFPSLVDLDGDNDLDLIFYRFDSLFNGALVYYENSLSPSGIAPAIDYTNQINIVPNPAREELTIVNSSTLNVVSVRVFNNSGKLISSIRENLNKPVAVNHLPNGLYILSIQLSNGQEVLKKIIVMNN